MYTELCHGDSMRATDSTFSLSPVEINFTEGSASPKPETSIPDDLCIFGEAKWGIIETEQEPCSYSPVKALVIYIMLSILVS